MHEFRVFDSRAAASIALADQIAPMLECAVAERGTASLVVPGGRSPVTMFRALRRHIIPWELVTLIPSDERLVAFEHEDRNERMIRDELMQGAAASASLLSLAGEEIPDDTRLADTNSQLGRLTRPLDAVVLGMGEDGHTASLFPDSPGISDAMTSNDYCVLQRPEASAVARLTLTPALLLDARTIFVLFFGHSKRAVYDRAVSGRSLEALPIRFLLRQQDTAVASFWAR